MKYTKDNIVGVKFDIGTSTYIVKETNGQIGLWGKAKSEVNKDYHVNCCSSAENIAKNLNNGLWKPINEHYEIY